MGGTIWGPELKPGTSPGAAAPAGPVGGKLTPSPCPGTTGKPPGSEGGGAMPGCPGGKNGGGWGETAGFGEGVPAGPGTLCEEGAAAVMRVSSTTTRPDL